jgi:transcriptional regulator with XRE-family HTH domain
MMNAGATIYSGNSDDDTLGGRLSRAREAAGISAAAFARQLGVRKETLLAWESDRAEPRANRLFRIAGMLGVSPAWLLGGLGEAPAEQPGTPALRQLRADLQKLKEVHEQTSGAIAAMEKALLRLEAEIAG